MDDDIREPIGTTEARQGVRVKGMRYVLFGSLALGAVALMLVTAVWAS